MDVSARIAEDLDDSGLTIHDLKVRDLDSPTRAATGVPYSAIGYVIPYYTIMGAPEQFYRAKVFDHDPKYKQPKDTQNHVYFPPGFIEVANTKPYILFTEGEKKAAAAVKAGFPCVAVGGIDSWRNRIIQLPEDTEFNKRAESLKAKLPSGVEVEENFLSPLAKGMQDLIDFVLSHNKHWIILYDQDEKATTSHKVQAAAAALGYELRFRGLAYNNIRQIRLPHLSGHEKFGLDDFLVEAGPANLEKLIATCLSKPHAFPRHPNVRDYLNKRLQKSKMSRKEVQAVSMAILSELDSNGMRLKNIETKGTYYFDAHSHRLLPTHFGLPSGEVPDSPFGQFMYREYGIGPADKRIMDWFGPQFTGEEPIEEVSPYRVLARPEFNADNVTYQISDGQYVEVSANVVEGSLTPGLVLRDNGTNNILFESGQVVALNPTLLAQAYGQEVRRGIPQNYWADVLSQVRLKDKSNQQRILASLLYYVAPWLNRWRYTQLPIEMTIGEAGSGKSTLAELRLEIISGYPHLRNAPQDWKDWAASVTSTGGLHIIDNLQLPDKNLRQRLSDEICRIITEPNPSIEQRKLYTNNDLMRLPVRCQFGITAIKQPFLNADVLARAIILELDKSQDIMDGNLAYDANWKNTQLQRFGGREQWVAHHLYVLHCFFKLVKQKWNHRYAAKYRLINVEQCLCLMAEVFGIKEAEQWIPGFLNKSSSQATVDADWALEGLIEYARTMHEHKVPPGHRATASEISEWCMSQPEYQECEELVNSRRLGRYMHTHKAIIAQLAGIIEDGKVNNRSRYLLRPLNIQNQKKPS